MKTSTKWFLGISGGLLVFAFLILGFFVLLFIAMTEKNSESFRITGLGKKVAVVELRGPIFESENIVKQFKKFRDRNDVKAILFRVDSPGGGVVASQEIYEEVKKTRDEGTPVVVSMGSVAASGGYYVSCGADRIVANRGTVTGSIGVISQFLRLDPLLHKVGIEANTIKSGKFKDTGSPFREMTPADKKYFQNLIDNVHRQFIDIVEHERSLKHAKAIEYADGRVFTGEQALKMGLVDTLGTYEDALRIAAEMGGIRGEIEIVKKEERKRPRLFDFLFGEGELSDLLDLKDEIFHQPILQYRYVQ